MYDLGPKGLVMTVAVHGNCPVTGKMFSNVMGDVGPELSENRSPHCLWHTKMPRAAIGQLCVSLLVSWCRRTRTKTTRSTTGMPRSTATLLEDELKHLSNTVLGIFDSKPFRDLCHEEEIVYKKMNVD